VEPSNRYDGVHPYAVRLIRQKAGELAGKYGWSRSDREDIEQELLLDLKFDPARAQLSTFIRRLVEHKVASMIEAQRATRRDYRKSRGSLNAVLLDGEGGGVEFGATLTGDEARKGAPRLSPEERRDLRIDQRRAVDELPPHLRDLARRLVRSSPSEIARDTGTPRTTIQKQVLIIRRHFERAGLAQYLPKSRRQNPDRSGT